MSLSASRLEKVEVDVTVPVVVNYGKQYTQNLMFTEKVARDLMHALAGALGYDAVPKL